MKATDFANAIQIISNYHNTRISINECVAAGYSLGMVAKGLSVDKI